MVEKPDGKNISMRTPYDLENGVIIFKRLLTAKVKNFVTFRYMGK